MTEPADQVSKPPVLPNGQSAPTSENPPILDKSKVSAAKSSASWADVQNAMQSAEDAVSKAVQGMADHQAASTKNNQ